LVTDLVDGTILVELVQALTGERLLGTVSTPQCSEDAVTNIQVRMKTVSILPMKLSEFEYI
jgi:hypothetical protein